jgi:hypothetical protein
MLVTFANSVVASKPFGPFYFMYGVYSWVSNLSSTVVIPYILGRLSVPDGPWACTVMFSNGVNYNQA